MADELEVLEKQQLSAQKSLNDLTDQLTLADHLVYKKYLTELQNYGMVELSQQMLDVQDPAQCIQLFQLQKLTLKKGEDMFQKLSTVYYSSMAQGCSLAVMIDVPDAGSGANIYLGVREDPAQKSMENRKLDISGKTLQKVLLSNFPGSEVTAVSQKEEDKLLNDPAEGAFGEYQEAVASVSCVAALRDKSKTEDKAFVQGIERFMDAMDGEVYTALFLAEPVSAETQAEIRSGYENLYSSLSPFRKSTWSYSENQSTAVMESLCSGTSHTISDTVSTTTTDGTSQSSSVTDGTQKTKGVSGGINGGVGSSSGTSVTKVSPVAGGIAGILGLGGAVASVAIPVAGAVIGPLLGTAGRAIGGMAPSRTAFNSIARNIGGVPATLPPSRPALRTAPPMGRRMEHQTPSASRRATAQQTPAAWAVPSRSSCATNRWKNCWNALKTSSSAPRKARITAVINVRLISFRLPRLRRYLRPILTAH